MENKPLLLCTLGHQNVPVIKRLIQHYNIAVFDKPFSEWAKSLGIPLICTRDFITHELTDQVKAIMLWETKKIMEKIVSGELVFDKEHPLLHGQGLGSWFPHYLYDRLVEIACRILSAASLAENHKIAGMVVGEDVSTHGRAVSLLGISEGYNTIHLAHANHFLKPGTTDLHCVTTAKYIGAAGEYMKQWYIDCGHPAEDIKILGAPQWDHLYHQPILPTREEARRVFGFEQDDLILTFASTWPQMINVGGPSWAASIKVLDDLWYTFIETAKKMNAKVIIKMHPTGGLSREDYFAEQLTEHGVKGAIMRTHGTHAIRAADCLVIQTSSNFSVEAAILGVPTVELYAPGSRVPYIPGTWGEDLEDLIIQAIKDGPSEELVRVMNYDNDGEATQRTVEWIMHHCPPG